MIQDEFKNIINNIKKEINTTQVKMAIEANKNLISLYYKLGKIFDDNSKYGNKFIEETSIELKLAFPDIKGFSVRNLKYMKKFYLEYKNNKLVQQIVAQIPWGHNIVLMTKIKDIRIRKIYAEAIIQNSWGRNMLLMQIENNYHLRIGNSSNNFKLSLPEYNSDLANSIIKDPYVFEFGGIKEKYKEKDLEEYMIKRIREVLLELGKGFSFIGNQYRISTDSNDYFIDLLFYHLDLRCYIVVEIKTGEFKPEYIGQLGFYVKAVDKILRKQQDNQTIGLLLCKDKDRLSVDWTLETLNIPVGVSSYNIVDRSSEEILKKLPTEEELNLHIDI